MPTDPESPKSTQERILALDGWRGIAIALVLIDHLQAALLRGYLYPWTHTGQHGVTIFFVLSGFLITSKLLQAPGDLKQFYLRRVFRLMPTAWVYLAALGILGWILPQKFITGAEFYSCVLFYRNFLGPQLTVAAGHFWSLSIEEQFYLVWPGLLLLAGIRSAKWFAVGAIAACAIYRFEHWDYYDRIWLSFRTEVRYDALLVGCLLSLLTQEARLRSIFLRWSRILAIPAFAFFLYCITRFHWLAPLSECLAIAILIAGTSFDSNSGVTRFLSFSPLVWLGTVSYSVYVWQQFFLQQWRLPQVSVGMICVMPIFALANYYWIERPCTRLGHRLTRRTILETRQQATVS
jgi:peptidoglycan/LPS O-acetylase OafA/YrhL